MTEEGKCAVLIKQIHSELEKTANNSLRKDDLTLSQINVLLELNKAPEQQLEQKQLEQILHVAQSTAAGIVRRLEQKGFVEGYESKQNKRIKIIHITPSGQMCCHKAEENMKRTEEKLTSALTDTERTILLTLLQKVRNSF